jgi:thermolysin
MPDDRGAAVTRRFILALALSAVTWLAPEAAQQPDQSIRLVGDNPDDLAAALARVRAMLSDGRLDLDRIDEDPILPGRRHERLVQRHEGLPVYGGEVVEQLDGRATVSVFGRVYDPVGIDVRPSIDADAALAVARADLGADALPWDQPELGILPTDDGRFVLAYRLRVGGGLDIRVYYIDARTGAIALSYSDLQAQAIGRGTGVFGDTKKVSTLAAAGTFQADDRLRPARGRTMDFMGSLSRLESFLFTGIVSASDLATDSDNTWTDGVVVDAHVYAGWVYDYYFRRFGRRGLNDNNLLISSIVHPLRRADALSYSPTIRGRYVNNALYLGSGFMLYGDGDGLNFDYLAAGLDVVAHELTHGVTDYSSNLIYLNEPGALNEAFSDIMGTAVEFFYETPGTGRQRADWLIGEDVTRFSPGFLRSMQNPVLVGNPDHYSVRFTGTADNGGVHINSSIINHAFYLAVAGGTNRVSGVTVAGIGLSNLERMEQIFYRAFVFMLSPSSRFTDARAATLQAASDLYGAGSIERAQLLQAWNAVGVN